MSTDPVPAALRAIASDERVARAEGALREATAQLRWHEALADQIGRASCRERV